MTPSNATSRILFTIGHSNQDLGDFLAVLVHHGVESLCDVRSRPGSFRFPQFNREPLEAAASCAKVQYQFLGESLGGRPEDPRVYRADGRVDYAARRKSADFSAGNSVAIPGDDVDLIGNGILDSMAWVSFLRTVESASGAGELGSGLNDRTASFSAVLAALKESSSPAPEVSPSRPEHTVSKNRVPAIIAGASAAVGSRVIPSEEVDRAFGMPIGKLRGRAGIESLAYAAEGENELALGARAALERFALRTADRNSSTGSSPPAKRTTIIRRSRPSSIPGCSCAKIAARSMSVAPVSACSMLLLSRSRSSQRGKRRPSPS